MPADERVAWTPLLSATARAQRAGPFKRLLKHLADPRTVSLAGGMPTPDVFPFVGVDVQLRDGARVSVSGEELGAALQYCGMNGYAPLLAWAQQHVREVHAPPNDVWTTAVSLGSSDGLYKTGMALFDPGDVVFSEEYTWVSLFSVARDRGATCVAVADDDYGLVPEQLEAACARAVAEGRRPKMVYLVPIGQNPTGTTLSMERKRQIYAIAQTYDLVIVEDDAYFFLTLPALDTPAETARMPGLHGLPPTMLSIDVDGRVVRLDTFAKAFGPGLRLGMTTAHRAIVEPMLLYGEHSTNMPNGVAAVIIHKTFEQWGKAGLHQHLCAVQLEFHRRRRVLLDLMDAHLTGLLQWKAPEAGMFVWVDFPGTADVEPLAEELIHEHRVLVIAGQYFSKDRKPTSRARLTFALATDEQMATGVRRLAAFLASRRAPAAGAAA